MFRRIMWWVGSFFLMIGIVAIVGAINAYRVSVGTPYYAGIVALAALPLIILSIAVLFFVLGSVRRKRAEPEL